ncbi:MAG: hypothetical protein PHU56_03275 [Candidatus Pacebacteria bacterium]|nr:hypothetical protein [Candidatus Paceibacterota bacterium]
MEKNEKMFDGALREPDEHKPSPEEVFDLIGEERASILDMLKREKNDDGRKLTSQEKYALRAYKETLMRAAEVIEKAIQKSASSDKKERSEN